MYGFKDLGIGGFRGLTFSMTGIGKTGNTLPQYRDNEKEDGNYYRVLGLGL